MKTLGQIAYERFYDDCSDRFWESVEQGYKDQWEAAAQAVRAAVIEECAAIAKCWSKMAADVPFNSHENNFTDGFYKAAYEIEERIRSLK